MREMLLAKVISFLKQNGFIVNSFIDSNSCFDLVARRDGLSLIIKVYSNIDALRTEQAEELLRVGNAFNAMVLIIGEKTKKFVLKNGITYERHSIPAMNFSTFTSMLSSFSPFIKSFKGRGIVELNSDKLRDKRKELDFSLEKLAERVGLTKESLYRFEHGASTSLETARKLEEVLKTDLILEKNLLEEFHKSQLQKKKELFGERIRDEVLEKIHGMGLDLIELSHSPFKAVGSKKEYLIIDKGKEKTELKKKALVLEKTKAVLDTHSLIITKKFDLDNIASTAVMKEEELDSYKRIHDLMDEVKKREKK